MKGIASSSPDQELFHSVVLTTFMLFAIDLLALLTPCGGVSFLTNFTLLNNRSYFSLER